MYTYNIYIYIYHDGYRPNWTPPLVKKGYAILISSRRRMRTSFLFFAINRSRSGLRKESELLIAATVLQAAS